MANANTTARFPTTADRARAEVIAKANTRPTFDGKLVARVVEVSTGLFAVLVDKNGAPFGAAAL